MEARLRLHRARGGHAIGPGPGGSGHRRMSGLHAGAVSGNGLQKGLAIADHRGGIRNE